MSLRKIFPKSLTAKRSRVRFRALVFALVLLTISFKQDDKKEKLTKALHPVLVRAYNELLTSQDLVLDSLKILDVDELTEKSDSLFSLKLCTQQMNTLQTTLEKALEKLARSSTIINGSRALSAELYNQALKQSAADLKAVEPVMMSFTVLSKQSALLKELINSNKLDSTNIKGHIAMFNLRGHDQKNNHFRRDSAMVTLRGNNIMRSGSVFVVDSLEALNRKDP